MKRKMTLRALGAKWGRRSASAPRGVAAEGAAAPYARSPSSAASATAPKPPAQRRNISRRLGGVVTNLPQWCMAADSVQEDELLHVHQHVREFGPQHFVLRPAFRRQV